MLARSVEMSAWDDVHAAVVHLCVIERNPHSGDAIEAIDGEISEILMPRFGRADARGFTKPHARIGTVVFAQHRAEEGAQSRVFVGDLVVDRKFVGERLKLTNIIRELVELVGLRGVGAFGLEMKIGGAASEEEAVAVLRGLVEPFAYVLGQLFVKSIFVDELVDPVGSGLSLLGGEGVQKRQIPILTIFGDHVRIRGFRKCGVDVGVTHDGEGIRVRSEHHFFATVFAAFVGGFDEANDFDGFLGSDRRLFGLSKLQDLLTE